MSRRWQRGEVFLYDPAGVTDMEASSWSPLPRSETWEGAYRMALALLGGGRGHGGDGPSGATPTLLASLLLAASISSRSMADVLRWAQRQDTAEVTAALSVAGEPAAADAFQSVAGLDRQARTQVYGGVLEVLGVYSDPALRESAVSSQLSAERLLDGPANTAYAILPAHEQRRLGPLDPALLVVLDDAANSAPLAGLDVLASTAAGHGVQLLTCFRHLGQLQARYGDRAEAVLDGHQAKVILSGITDPPTLAHLSQLLGDETIRHLATPAALAKAGQDKGEPQPIRARYTSPAEALRWIAPGQGRDQQPEQVLRQRARVRREVEPAWFQQPPAADERALADRVQDRVVGLRVPGEVLGLVVDHPFGAQALDQLHVLGAADRRHPGAEAGQQLDRRRADGPGRAVDQDGLPAADLGLPDHREGVVRALAAGGRLLVRQARRHGRERVVLGDRQVLGVRAEPQPGEPEHPVADLERRDARADRLDPPRVLVAEDRQPWPGEPVKNRTTKGLTASHPQSVRLTVVAWTLTSSSPSPGAGLSTSAIRTTSGGP